MTFSSNRPRFTLASAAIACFALACDPASKPAAKPTPAASAKLPAQNPDAPPSAASLVKFSAAVHTTPEGDRELVGQFDIADGWHIYWENPGDSGLPTRVKSTDPKVKLGRNRYPLPKRFGDPDSGITYGYEGSACVFSKLDTSNPSASPLTVKASFLVCDESGCIRGNAKTTAQLPETAPTLPPKLAQLRKTIPQPAQSNAAPKVDTRWSRGKDGLELALSVDATQGATLKEFYPLETRPAVLVGQQTRNGAIVLRYTGAETTGTAPWSERVGVAVVAMADGSTQLREIAAPMDPSKL